MNHEGTYKEIFDVVEDARDPAGVDPSARGLAPGYDLSKSAIGRPMIWYEVSGTPMPMTWDVYQAPDGSDRYIQGLCPACIARGRPPDHCGLTIRHDAKPFSYDPRAEVPPFPGWTRAEMQKARPHGFGGLLTIEAPIACTWEEAPELQRGFGLSRCNWKVQIVKNVARDVR